MKKAILALASLIILALIVVPTFPQAQPITNVYDMPFDVTWNVPCANGGAGEDVHIAGIVHAVETVVINKDKVHMVWTYNPKGLTGVGLITGTTYHATGVTRQDIQANGIVFPWNLTFVNRGNLVSEGPEANSMVFGQTVHITVNANGETTIFFDNPLIHCK